ncbi:MAG: XRE family transcriptional regulator [Clostridia bacterium]|nr:XRE family transcriptional regulator [Clostridia bacterium]
MTYIKTDDLLGSLRNTTTLDDYLTSQKQHFLDTELPGLLERLCDQKQMSKAQVFHGAELNEIYGYQIFAGKRRPSRDKLLCIGLSLGLNEDEMQSLLKSAEMAPLYPKLKRDSIILFGFMKNQSVMEVNQSLFANNLETL